MTDLIEVIQAVAPDVDLDAWAAALEAPMRSAGITTPRRIAMFLGQCAAESGFADLVENLDYESAVRICEVWPSRFATVADAEPYVLKPESLANRVYADRMGNGDEASGDGWRFRGRGLIQLTGRDQYQSLASADPRAADPNWVATPTGAAFSACWFWSSPRTPSFNALSDAWDIRAVTWRINGSQGDLDRRIRLTNTAWRAFGLAEPPAGAGIPVVSPGPRVTTADLNAAELDAITGVTVCPST